MCVECGGEAVIHHPPQCLACYYADVDDPPTDEHYEEPVGSCDECHCNLYEDDNYDGLCNSCAWHAQQR